MKYLTTLEQYALKEARLAAESRGEKRGKKRGKQLGKQLGEIVGQITLLENMKQGNMIQKPQYELMIQPLRNQLKQLIEKDDYTSKSERRYYRKFIEV